MVSHFCPPCLRTKLPFPHCVAHGPDRDDWFILDGPSPAVVEQWTAGEAGNQAADAIGGAIEAGVRMIYESDNLCNASPAVSRCGIVYMPSQALKWRTLV